MSSRGKLDWFVSTNRCGSNVRDIDPFSGVIDDKGDPVSCFQPFPGFGVILNPPRITRHAL